MAENRSDKGYHFVLAGFRGIIRILVYVLAAVILIVLGKKAYTIGYEVVSTAPAAKENGADVTVAITDDMSVLEIGEMLNEWGLIREQPISFWTQELLSEYHNKILPGTYVLNTGMTVDEMLKILSQSEEKDQEKQS